MSSLSIVEAKLPPGFRFHPRDDELICDYLMKKKDNNNSSKIKPEAVVADYCSSELDSSSSSSSPSSSQLLVEVDLNKCEPWDIPKQACVGGKDFYFYSQRDRKYATGLRTNRATVSGYWKATGKDRPIARKGHLVGMRKTLVFYQGRAPKGRKTNWVMHEFRIEGPHGPPPLSASSKEDWVLCRVFRKSAESSSTKQSEDTGDEDHDQVSHCDDEETASPASTLPALMDSYIAFEHRRRKITTEMNHHDDTIINSNNINIHAYEQVPCFSSNMFSLNQATSLYPAAAAFPQHIYSNTTDVDPNNIINMTSGMNPIISYGNYDNNHHAFGGSLLSQDEILASSSSTTSNAARTASGEMNCNTRGGYVFDNGAADQLSACDKHVIKAVLSQLTKMQEGSGVGNSNLQLLGKDASPVVSLGEAASSDQSYLSDVGLHNPTTTTMWNNRY